MRIAELGSNITTLAVMNIGRMKPTKARYRVAVSNARASRNEKRKTATTETAPCETTRHTERRGRLGQATLAARSKKAEASMR